MFLLVDTWIVPSLSILIPFVRELESRNSKVTIDVLLIEVDARQLGIATPMRRHAWLNLRLVDADVDPALFRDEALTHLPAPLRAVGHREEVGLLAVEASAGDPCVAQLGEHAPLPMLDAPRQLRHRDHIGPP